MAYEYRHLSSSDLGLLTQLLKLFADVFDEQNTYQGNVPSDEYLVDLLNKGNPIFVVTLDGDSVVGGLAAYELQKFEQDRSEVYIYDLGVAKAFRRKGIATAMIKEVKKIAKDRGAWVIFVQADQGDTPAIKLYESLGKREDIHHFDIPVK